MSEHKITIVPSQLAYSLEQAAGQCGVSLSHFKKFISAGDVNARQMNTKKIVPAWELAEFIDSLPFSTG